MSTRDALLAEVARHDWLYTQDLGGGVSTPGRFGPPNRQIEEVFDKIDFSGKQVLEVGCFEGHWSFALEKRGATVVATDYLVGDDRAVPNAQGIKELPTFRLAHTILGSRVEYRPDVSVYDVLRLERHDFDVVVFCGVYYHLKHPLLALSRLRQVIREGGTLIVEGPVIEGPQEPFARFFYEDVLSQDRSNWWVPTVSCLREWIACSYFEILDMSDAAIQEVRPHAGGGKETVGRRTLVARAVSRPDARYVLPDEELARYDRGPTRRLTRVLHRVARSLNFRRTSGDSP